ncbi:MAG: hypothetical protein LBK27_02420 [Treponema sp.]|jgi:hypothetical protein|nr:hypothetical protein [Treponema sp.]
MQELVAPNDLFKQYAWGNLERKKFEGLLFQYILENNWRFNLGNWERDDYADYLGWFYPRMRRAIDSYRDAGASFETYIGAIMRWSAREYRFRLSDKYLTEHTTWSLKTVDMMLHENEPDYIGPEEQADPPFSPRQMLILILKSYYFVSDDFVDRMAPVIKIHKEKLHDLLAKIRELRAERDAEIHILRERCHCQFYRCMTYERRMRAVQEHSAFHTLMKSRLERARQRLTAIRQRLARTRLEATNVQVAQVLGIPKGTVDSTMFLLKNRMNREKRRPPENVVEN